MVGPKNNLEKIQNLDLTKISVKLPNHLSENLDLTFQTSTRTKTQIS